MQEAGTAKGEVRAREAHVPGHKILCIDDDSFIIQVLTSALKDHGFVPLSAPDGPTGIALAMAERPTLILLDIVMPGIDGFEVCRRLKAGARTQAIPVIILTSQADPKLNIKAFQAGADLALTKPVEPGKLIATLRAALALKHGRSP